MSPRGLQALQALQAARWGCRLRPHDASGRAERAARRPYGRGGRAARGVLTLTAERFPSRTENRRYLIHQLELLKRAASEADDEFDAAWRRLAEGGE